jgi:hypothetical protein
MKIKNKINIRIRKKLRKLHLIPLLLLAGLLNNCATTIMPSMQAPPRLAAPPATNPCLEIDCDLDFEPPLASLPFVKHPLAELIAEDDLREAQEVSEERANPEREAREAEAAWRINDLVTQWDHP